MSAPTAFAIANLLSDLIGRSVSVAVAINPPASKLRQIYGIYAFEPAGGPMLVKADLPLLAMLGGTLLGLPNDTAIEQAQSSPMAEPIRDAIHEVMNITSAALSCTDRIVFKKMVLNPIACEGAVGDLLQAAKYKSSFNFSIANQPSGLFTLLS